MTQVILSQADYDNLCALIENARIVYNTAEIARGVGHNVLQSDIAMARLKVSLDAVEKIQVTPYVDNTRVSTTKKRRR